MSHLPAFTPPEPYPPEPLLADEFWYGSPALWTLLPLDGTWEDLPYDKSSGYTQKVFFWRDGYDPSLEPQPAIKLRGQRLDGKGGSFESSETTHAMGSQIGSAMLVGVSIPSAGCWQFSAEYAGDELRFTLLIEP